MRARLGEEPSDFEPERLAGHALERRGVPRRGPELQLGVARRAQLQQVVVAAVVDLEAGDALCVAAVEALRQPQNGRQRADGAARAARQLLEALVAALRRPLPMVAGDQRDRLDLLGLEPAQVAVLHQVVRVLVVSLVADQHADVVQNRRVLEPLALAIGEAVNRARLVEQADGETRDVLRVIGPVLAAVGELEHAPAADVGVAVGLRDFLAVARDVIEHESFAQRQVAERDFVGAEASQELVEQDRARDHEVRAPRLEPRNAQPLLEIEGDDFLPHVAD